MEIGQFLNMKYNTGNRKTIAVYIGNESICLCIKKNICAEIIADKTTTVKRDLGYLLFNGCPWLFIKIPSFVRVTLLKIFMTYATEIKERIKPKGPKYGSPKLIDKSPSTLAEIPLKIAPNQNNRFQALSSFSRAFIQFIGVSKFKLYALIIPCYTIFRKVTIGNIS